MPIVECLIKREGNTEFMREGVKYVFQYDPISKRSLCHMQNEEHARTLCEMLPDCYKFFNPVTQQHMEAKGLSSEQPPVKTEMVSEDGKTEEVFEERNDDFLKDEKPEKQVMPVHVNDFLNCTKKNFKTWVMEHEENIKVSHEGVIERMTQKWKNFYDTPFPINIG